MLRYKINILLELKKAGYPSTRLRQEKIIGESTIQKLRTGNTSINLGDLVEWVEDA